MSQHHGDNTGKGGTTSSNHADTITTIGNGRNELSLLLPTSQDEPSKMQLATLAKARRVLYLSHLFSQFSEVAWQFCLILFLAAFANYQSLILVSSYGLISNGSVCLFAAKAGHLVDGANRLFVARCFILSENCCVILATVFSYLLLGRTLDSDQTLTSAVDLNGDRLTGVVGWLARRFDQMPLDAVSLGLLLGIHVFGSIAVVLDKGFLVAMERDWIVVMSEYAVDRKQWLTQTNVSMKQIDLSSQIVAPAVAGLLLSALDDGTSANHGRDLRWAAILVGAINGSALIVEFVCTAWIYQMLPALARKANPTTGEESGCGEEMHSPTLKDIPKGSRMIPWSLQIYLDQPISFGGISLSLLYLNVLSFGSIMTAYLVWRGMGMDSIGVLRGVSSAVGLMGTFAYHFSAERTDLFHTGMWSISYQFACLSMSYLSLFVPNHRLSLALLIVGVCSSRIGLWVFDITITQLMQEHVPVGFRGVVGGVQHSLNAFFFLLSFGLGFLFPDPNDFPIYVAVGYASVGIALILYGFKIFARRGSFVTAQ